jgi:hypothetical protein
MSETQEWPARTVEDIEADLRELAYRLRPLAAQRRAAKPIE